MSDRTAIEWAANADGTPGATWNPIRARDRASGKVGWFCIHKSDGCKFCYAEPINRRFGTGRDYAAQNLKHVEIFIDKEAIVAPARWRKPRTVFVCSMTDLFAEFVPDELIDCVFNEMQAARRHTFIVLTKRPDRMRAYFARFKPDGQGWVTRDGADGFTRASGIGFADNNFPLANVWLGVSVENQKTANERIPQLLETPAAIRFLSVEPLLAPVTFEGRLWLGDHETENNGPILRGIDWVIVGGESGRAARPMHPDWARSVRDQCAEADVPFFFKQWGAWAPHNGHSTLTEPGWPTMYKATKAIAGRILDGRTHDERPPLIGERPS